FVRSTHQRSETVAVDGVDVVAGTKHAAKQGEVAVPGRLLPVETGCSWTQEIDNVLTAAGGRDLERRFVIVDPGDLVGVRSMGEQLLHHFEVTFSGREMQWGVVVDTPLTHVRAVVEQQLHKLVN